MKIKEKETTTQHYKNLSHILGEKYIRTKIESPFDFITLASNGINANIIVNFRKYFNLPRPFTAKLLNISEPTIYRWVRNNKKLDRNYAIQLFELSDLFLYGSEVFESRANFFKWLLLPNVALGGLEPKELLEIPGGTAKVKEVIGRIDNGVFS